MTTVQVNALTFDVGDLRKLINAFEAGGECRDPHVARCVRDMLYQALERCRRPHARQAIEAALERGEGLDDATVREVEARGSTVEREAAAALCARVSRPYATPYGERGYRRALARRRVPVSPAANLDALRALHLKHHAPCPACGRGIVHGDACMSLGCGHLAHTVCMKTKRFHDGCMTCAKCSVSIPLDRTACSKLLKRKRENL